MEKQLEGTLIAGRYAVRKHLATGGMAAVFTGWDHRVERPIAIKVLRALDKTDQRAIDRFRREARAAASLMHPNAVTIYDFIEEHNEYFLVMEYVDGPNLKQLLHQRGRLPPEEAITYASQICGVLQKAHNRGFIHRDIKPQNILIAQDGQAKLTDFGIVRVREGAGLTNTGIVLGTADYLAPEQARGEELTPASDLYSLGVVLYEMLCGHPPFSGPTAVAVAMQHARTPPPPLASLVPDLPPTVEQVVAIALEKAPERRFHSALAMRHALESSLWLATDSAAPLAEDGDQHTIVRPTPVPLRPEPSVLPWEPAPSQGSARLRRLWLAIMVGSVLFLLIIALWLAR